MAQILGPSFPLLDFAAEGTSQLDDGGRSSTTEETPCDGRDAPLSYLPSGDCADTAGPAGEVLRLPP